MLLKGFPSAKIRDPFIILAFVLLVVAVSGESTAAVFLQATSRAMSLWRISAKKRNTGYLSPSFLTSCRGYMPILAPFEGAVYTWLAVCNWHLSGAPDAMGVGIPGGAQVMF